MNKLTKLFPFILICFHLFILTHLRFEVWPEMVLMPYLMKNGFELYRDMIVPWTPGLMWILSGWFSLVGLSIVNLKLLTWTVIIIIDTLIYLIARKKYNEKAGLRALLFFVLFQPLFDGNGIWFDLAVVPCLLLAFYFQNPIFLGPAFLIKQSAVWLFPLFLKKWKQLVAGMLGALGISGIWFFTRGTFADYWYWAYNYVFRVFPSMPGHKDLGNWREWMMALAPFVLVVIYRGMRKVKGMQEEKIKDPFWWAVLAIPLALPRFGLFHFQPAVAFLALAAGKEIGKLGRWKNLTVLGFLVYLIFMWGRVIKLQWNANDRFLEPEVYQLVAKVALETDKSRPVLLVNSPELIYVLTDRLPPKPWLTQFSWFLELPGFQEKLIKNFKAQDLQQIIFTPYNNEGEFVPGSYQPKELLEYLHTLI